MRTNKIIYGKKPIHFEEIQIVSAFLIRKGRNLQLKKIELHQERKKENIEIIGKKQKAKKILTKTHTILKNTDNISFYNFSSKYSYRISNYLKNKSTQATLPNLVLYLSLIQKILLMVSILLYLYTVLLIVFPPSSPPAVGYLGLVLCFVAFYIGKYLFLFTTRLYKVKREKKLSVLKMSYLTVLISFVYFLNSFIPSKIYPYYLERESNLSPTMSVIFKDNAYILSLIFLIIPLVLVFIFHRWYFDKFERIKLDFAIWIDKYEFRSVLFHELFISQNKIEFPLPTIDLAPSRKHKEMVQHKGNDRATGSIITGPPGTGKSAALLLQQLNNDLHWMTHYINTFADVYPRKDYHSKKISGSFLNSIVVIEPSGDLTDKVYRLAKAHGIPLEAICYIDPMNPFTPSINLLKGPVDKVAEVFTMVISGLQEGGKSNEFFLQAQRNHLKQYIYLLKLHDPKKVATFDILMNMYSDIQLVYTMYLSLGQRYEQIKSKLDKNSTRDERNRVEIIKNVVAWFKENIGISTDFRGNIEKVKEAPYRGQPVCFDRQAQYVSGLRNILNDISTNEKMRRVLFGDSDFNLDSFLEMGGILLVATRKGELSNLSNVLGKFILLSVQNAVFRRKPNISSYLNLTLDEFPDFIVKSFKEFPAQSRKYKAIPVIAKQSLSQLSMDFSTDYLDTLLSTLRNKFVFGGVIGKDAEIFSKQFGDKFEYKQTETIGDNISIQENEQEMKGLGFRRERIPQLAAGDIVNLPSFVCAAQLLKDNSMQDVELLDANFVNPEEFLESIVTVEKEKADVWLSELKLNKLKHDNTTDAVYNYELLRKNLEEALLDETLDLDERIDIEMELDKLPNDARIIAEAQADAKSEDTVDTEFDEYMDDYLIHLDEQSIPPDTEHYSETISNFTTEYHGDEQVESQSNNNPIQVVSFAPKDNYETTDISKDTMDSYIQLANIINSTVDTSNAKRTKKKMNTDINTVEETQTRMKNRNLNDFDL